MTQSWRSKLRDYHVPIDVGYDVCQVSGTSESICGQYSVSQRKRALKNNMMYCARTRDPPSNTGESGGESATEDVDGMLCGSGAVVDTTPLCTGLPVYSRPHGVGTVQKSIWGVFHCK
jgi:hypothetical protein